MQRTQNRTVYFQGIRTIEELKKEYKKLAMLYHPDRPNGNTEIMQEINNQYEKMFDKVKHVHTDKAGKEYTKQTTETAREYPDIINSIIHLPEITIEICGSWIWVTGNTFQYKTLFHSLNFKWSQSKRAWFWASDIDDYKHRKSFYTLDKIRETFGTENVESKPFNSVKG